MGRGAGRSKGQQGGDRPSRCGPRTSSYGALEAALRAHCTSDRFPTLEELDLAGRRDLRRAVERNGGVAFWADRLGLQIEDHRRPSSYAVEEAIRDATAIIRATGELPGAKALRPVNRNLATVVRAHGGARKFRQTYGL